MEEYLTYLFEKNKSKLTAKQKLGYRMAVKYICEECHKPEKEVGTLQVHRIDRGYNGGEYCPRNVKIICKKCHKRYHYKEFK